MASIPIAIIGMSCRFAGDATSPEKLWKLSAEGGTAWSEVPASKFNLKGVYHPNGERAETTNVIGGHFLKDDVAGFDAAFFGFPADLASCMDPQYRLQLEGTYEALESAGLTLDDVAGSNTSMYAGAFFRDYQDAQLRDPLTLPRQQMLGVGAAMAANRLSHFFDLRGPSMAIDTGCSTTLTALHQACQSLRTGESDMSIVGGANVMINSDIFVTMSSLHFLSPEGRCFAFDSRAGGYGRGEGSATIIVKRLDDASKNGDPIRAIIRNTGLNQDGKTETITAPSALAQEALIREVYSKAGLDPAETRFFEAHGTGTPTGDPLEISAISSVFSSHRSASDPLFIGSVKTNIGHTETSSGLASIIRTTLAMEKGQIPPSGTFKQANPTLKLDERFIKVPEAVQEWPDVNGVRRASVNNFGYGGANAHVIMESYPSFLASHKSIKGSEPAMNGWHDSLHSRVLMLSAKDEQAVSKMAVDLKEYLESSDIQDEHDLVDNLIYTLGQRRTIFPWRIALPITGTAHLTSVLQGPQAKPKKALSSRSKIGFVFSGQGAQWFAMGRELIAAYPVFRSAIMNCDQFLQRAGAEWSLQEELMKDAETSLVNQLAMSTPLSVAVQIALVELLKDWGINPTAVTSHSSGEVPAAYAAGAISMRTAMEICYARAKHAGQKVPGLGKGGMIAIGLGPDAGQIYLDRLTKGRVVIACFNSPTSITASGDYDAIEELEGLLKDDNVFARRLRIDCAYHSHHMKAIAEPYYAWLDRVMKPQDSMDENVVFSSPTTGKREYSGLQISSAQHWVDSLTRPVSFTQAFKNMCFETADSTTSCIDTLIEVGPHAALSGPIQDIISEPEFKSSTIDYFPTLVRKSNAITTMQDLACNLIKAGHPVNMEAVNFPFGRPSTTRVLFDLPSYPWNHTVKHWGEPRLNKALRDRSHEVHDLLGAFVPGTNTTAPSWRHIIRLADVPWLFDHVVQTDIIYPGAGFLCMAIEAAGQLARDENKQILGYELRDVYMPQALLVPDDPKGVEVQLTLRPCPDKALYSHGWKDFTLCSVNHDSEWLEHCKGRILTVLKPAASASGSDDVSFMESRKANFGDDEDYWKQVDIQDFYSTVRLTGIHHGPNFQGLQSIRTRQRKSLTTIEVADTAATMPQQHEHAHTIHPTTLDTLFQTSYSAYMATPESGFKLSKPLVPHTIKRLRLTENPYAKAHCELKAYSDISAANMEGYTADISLFPSDVNAKGKPIVAIEGFSFKSIGTAMTQKPTDVHDLDKLAAVEWKRDLDLVDLKTIKQELETPFEPEEQAIVLKLARVSLHYIADTVAALSQDNVSQLEWYHSKYLTWMKAQLNRAAINELGPDSSTWLDDSAEVRASLAAEVRTESVDGEMVCHLGPNLLGILRHEVTPLELMMEDGLLNRYYENALKWDRSSRKFAQLVKHATTKNPRARIIEIGGGTGCATKHVLDVLGSEDSDIGCQAELYDFTDISNGFFEAARKKFNDWPNVMRFKRLDIEDDITKQGFEEESYDIVIACQVLHATKNMQHTMRNVRKLLKPNGRLFLFETTQDPLALLMTFGLLPGWWLSEEKERHSSPSLSINMWDRVLRDSGFGGIDVEIHDCDDDDFYNFSTIMSTASPAEPPAFDADITIVTNGDEAPSAWVQSLQCKVQSITGSLPSVQDVATVDAQGKVCIFVGELGRNIMEAPTPEQFAGIKAIATQSKAILWATRGGRVDVVDPSASASLGFNRVVREEYSGKRVVNIDLNPSRDSWSESSIAIIGKLYQTAFDMSKTLTDFEYAEVDGEIFIPRYYKDGGRNTELFKTRGDDFVTKEEVFNQAHRSLRLSIGTPGLLDTLAFIDNDQHETQLPDHHVEIRPCTFGVNFRDVMTAMGQLNNNILGFECAGIITRVGPVAAAKGFKAGDRVASLLRGHYANLVRTEWSNTVHIPETMSFEEAASVPMAFATAWISLYDLGHLQSSDSVLIHGASGGVGQAAVLLAQHTGAEVFVTVSAQEKRDLVKQRFGIADDHILSSRDASFADGIMSMTQNRGVDVVVNHLAGALLQASFDSLARFGRFVEIGKKDVEANNFLQMEAFTRNVTFSSFDLLQFEEFRPEQTHKALKGIMDLLQQKQVRTIEPINSYPLSDLEKTFRLMQAGKHIGKIVLSLESGVQVPVLQRRGVVRLQSDASYLIVGGLGGIGRSICHWMADHGAKHIAVLSRSAAASGNSGAFIRELASTGVTITPIACDASDAEKLSSAITQYESQMPEIRGVIQGAMVLADAVVEQMNVENYTKAVRPKIQGSWNLHNIFNHADIDFFVMLSSLAGVAGTVSQANYAAGNTYQDALARYRVNNGLHGATIDLGVIKNVGYLVDHRDQLERLRKQGFHVLDEEDVLATIESAISSSPRNQMLLGANGTNLDESKDARFWSIPRRPKTSAAGSAVKTVSSDLGAAMMAATSIADAVDIVASALVQKLAGIFMLDAAEISPSSSVVELGVDSLVAVELRNLLALRAGAQVSIFDIMQSTSLLGLSEKVVMKSTFMDASALS
ncbi:putative polyketide synthase [Aureobasidium subglaciale]|nr:putative polyketide synthase [Aureobasidium subglaciale]